MRKNTILTFLFILVLTYLVVNPGFSYAKGTAGAAITTEKAGISVKAKLLSRVSNPGIEGLAHDIASDGKSYVSVGLDGIIKISYDIKNWKLIEGVAYSAIYGIEWNGKEYVAIGKNFILKSADGLQWEKRVADIKFVGDYGTFKWTPDGYLVSRYAENGKDSIYRTKDFENWEYCDFINQKSNYGSGFSFYTLNGRYFFQGFDSAKLKHTLYYSDDLVKWEQAKYDFGIIEGVEYFNKKYLVVARDDKNIHVYSSADLVNWDKNFAVSDLGTPPQVLVMGNKLHIINNKYRLVSDDGISFTQYSQSFTDMIYDYFAFDNCIIGILKGRSGYEFVYSYGDNQWNTVGEPKEIPYISYQTLSSNSKLIFSDNNGKILYSKNGYDWIKVSEYINGQKVSYSPKGYSFKDIILYWNKLIARDQNDVSYVSEDYINWKEEESTDEKTDDKSALEKVKEKLGLSDWLELEEANDLYFFCEIHPVEYDLDLPRPNFDPVSIYVIDKNFNIVNQKKFEGPIGNSKYVGNRVYVSVETKDGSRCYFYNGGKWELFKCGNELLDIPLTNGKGSFFTRSFSGNSYVSNDGAQWKRVVFEESLPGKVIERDNYFVTLGGNKIYFSKEGIYWMSVTLPDIDEGLISQTVYGTDEAIMVEKGGWLYSIPRMDIENRLTGMYPSEKVFVELDGKVLGFTVAPVIQDNRTLVPLRFIFEKMGAVVTWDGVKRSAIVSAKGRNVSFRIDDTGAQINGNTKQMEVPARLIEGKTMVPLRFISEGLGYKVNWVQEENTAVIKG